MKSLTIVWILASVFAISAFSMGCSSAPKASDQPQTISPSKAESPINLGAASAGRGR